MKKSETIYVPETEKQHLSLTAEQKEAIRQIIMGIEEVDASIRDMAVPDVIETLENGHPLNRLITKPEGETVGYIACQDFAQNEAYIKYFGTTGQTGRNLLREIPAFLEYAKQQGFTKLSFHGWNDRLNRILQQYGFERKNTDTWLGFNIGFYEKTLAEQKPQANVEGARRKAFKKKYLDELNQKYQQIMAGFSTKTRRKDAESKEVEFESDRSKKEAAINTVFQSLSGRLERQPDFTFGEIQKAVLKLKLARHFQHNETVDVNTLFDAIVESPKFITNDKGSLYKLLEVHKQKTLQKIAEIPKRRAEMTSQEGLNPYENLFTTASGNYYMARLLNKPHLEAESEYMSHCVGTSDSYINQIKRGDIEILSFRHVPKINPSTQKLEGDEPIMTIEYNLKTKTIEQMKTRGEEYLKSGDPFFKDVVDALKQLRTTQTDTGQPRDFNKIAASELKIFKVKDYHVLTENGEVSFHDFNPDAGIFTLKMGDMKITPNMALEDVTKIIKIVEGIDCKPKNIARAPQEITEDTTIYIGELTPDILQSSIEHIYVSFPEVKVTKGETVIDYDYTTLVAGLKEQGKTEAQIQEVLKTALIAELDGTVINGIPSHVGDFAKEVIRDNDFIVPEVKYRETINFVRLSVRALGLKNKTTTEEIMGTKEDTNKQGNPAAFTNGAMTRLGLELLPPEFVPRYRKLYSNQPLGEWLQIAMKPILDRRGDPDVFNLGRDDGGLWLLGAWAGPTGCWNPEVEFLFRLRPPEAGKQVLET